MYEWDPIKRLSNIQKHQLDFIDAPLVFEGPILRARAKTVANEQRWLATGLLHGVAVTMIYTTRNNTIRLISMRKARHAEETSTRTVFRL